MWVSENPWVVNSGACVFVISCVCVCVLHLCMHGFLYSVPWNLSKRRNKNIYFYTQILLLAITPIPSSTAVGALRLFNLHYSKGQSMEEGPFVGNCQRRQGPQAWSPRVKSAYLGCHLDMTGPQGQGRGVKLLTTLNVAPALLFYRRHEKWLICIYYTSSFTPHPHPKNNFFSHICYSYPVLLQSDWSTFYAVWYLPELFKTVGYMHCLWTEDTMTSAYFGHDICFEKPVCIKVICDIVMWIKFKLLDQ